MADEAADVLLHHEFEFGDEVGIVPVAVEDVMLGATRAVDVPERFPRQFFYRGPVAGFFVPNVHAGVPFLSRRVRECFHGTTLWTNDC